MWGMWRSAWYTGSTLLNSDPNNFLTLQILAAKDSKNALFADNCTPLGYYAASSCNFLATFRDNLSVPSTRCVITQKNEVLIYFAAKA